MSEMTLDQWADLPEDMEGELVDGRLVEEEVPSLVHETVVAWLVFVLKTWLKPRGGWVFASEGKYAVRPKTGRKPDVVVYLPGRKPEPRGVVRLPPDIVVEVLSERPRDQRRDRIDKAKDYAAFGVRLYVLVDPEARTLEVKRLTRGRWVVATKASRGCVSLSGCEGLALDLDDLWSEVESIERISN